MRVPDIQHNSSDYSVGFSRLTVKELFLVRYSPFNRVWILRDTLARDEQTFGPTLAKQKNVSIE